MVSRVNNLDPGLTADLALQVAEICRSSDPGAGIDGLLESLRTLVPGWTPRQVMTRGGWHRLGGLVDLDGNQIADHITEWAESE